MPRVAKIVIKGCPLPITQRGNYRQSVINGRCPHFLEEFGADLSLPHVKKVRGKIWELRCDGERIFYTLFGQREIVLLHGFSKKRQKIPEREIRSAEQRLADFERRQEK